MLLRRLLSVWVVAFGVFAPTLLSAQDDFGSKTQVFGGYSQYRVGGKVDGVTLPSLTTGWAGQFMFSNGHASGGGLVVGLNGHTNPLATSYDLVFGPRYQVTWRHFIPFANAMMGVQHFSPNGFPSQNKPVFVFGGGLDIKLNSKLSIRPIDIAYVNALYTASSLATQSNFLNGSWVQAGLSYQVGLPAGPSGSAECDINPPSVDAGVPVNIDVTAKGFRRNRTLNYIYSCTGGKVEGHTRSTTVDTTGLEAGDYTVSANVEDDSTGRHRRMAHCEATFTVNPRGTGTSGAGATEAKTGGAGTTESASNKAPESGASGNKAGTGGAGTGETAGNKAAESEKPPTLALSPLPDKVKSGDSLTITAHGSSPDNRPVSVDCTTTGGSLAGAGSTFTLDSSGVKDGSITVNCTATDDRKLTTSASAAVKVVQRPNAKKFGRIDFVHDLKRPTRVDNQAKGELDRYADALAAEPEAKGVVVGYATEKEEKEEEVKNGSEPHPSVAALRGVNTKDYLRRDKGIDGARIEARAGRGRKSADLWVVPAEARLKLPGTTVVDESKVKAIPRVTHHRKTKKAAQTAHKKAGKSSGGVQSKHVQSKHVQSKQAQGKHPVPVPKKKGKRR